VCVALLDTKMCITSSPISSDAKPFSSTSTHQQHPSQIAKTLRYVKKPPPYYSFSHAVRHHV
jgi:hypothetical protein